MVPLIPVFEKTMESQVIVGTHAGKPVTSPSPHATEGEQLIDHPTDHTYPYQLNDMKAGVIPMDGYDPEAS